ncbi:MAG: caspase family protein [Chitinophagaceae bacterium]|nr:caspase family protein [Chitinophagaceae bacterium]
MKTVILSLLFICKLAAGFTQQPELVLPVGHTGSLTGTLITPDQKFIVTASEDGTAKIWNNRTGKLRFNLVLHSGSVTDIAMSKDGSFIILGSGDGTYSKWEIATGKLLYHSLKAAPIEQLFLLSGDSVLILQKPLTLVRSYMKEGIEDEIFAGDNSQFIKLFTVSPDKKTVALYREFDGLCFYETENFEMLASTDRVTADSGYYEMSLVVPRTIFFLNNQTVALLCEKKVTAFFNAGNARQLYLNERGMTDVEKTPDGKYAVLLHARKDSVTVIDLMKQQPVIAVPLSKVAWVVYKFTATDSSFIIETDKTQEEYSRTGEVVATRNLKENPAEESNDMFKGKVEALKKTFMSQDGNYIFELRTSQINYWKVKVGRSIRFPTQEGYNSLQDIYLTADPGKVILRYYSSFGLYDLEKEQMLYHQELDKIHDLILNQAKTELVGSVNERWIVKWNISTGMLLNQLQLPVKLNTIAVSADGQLLAGIKEERNNDSIQVWNFVSGELVTAFERPGQYIEGGWVVVYTPNYKPIIEFSENANYLFYSKGDRGELGAVKLPFWEKYGTEDSAYNPDPTEQYVPDSYYSSRLNIIQQPNTPVIFVSRFLPESPDQKIVVYDYVEGKNKFELVYPDFHRVLTYSLSKNSLYTATSKELLVWNISSGKLVRKYALPPGFDAVMYYEESNKLIIKSNDRIGVMEPGSTKPAYYLSTLTSGDFIVYRSDRYYLVTPSAVRLLAWKSENQFYDFDQWDIQYNRPDKVIESLDNPKSLLAAAYYKAYLKRLKKTGINESIFRPGLKVPVTTILEPVEDGQVVNTSRIVLKVNCKDLEASSTIVSVYVTINDVPLYGNGGLKPAKPAPEWELSVPVLLTGGNNKISISCFNNKGVESMHEQVSVIYQPKETISGTVHFIGIGINQFKDSKHNLQWCVKDIRDLALKFKEKYGSSIIIDTLFDQNVTLANVQSLKEKLLQTNINDKVIIAYSGHGLLSKQYDYYLSSFDVNFSKPEENGIAYEEIENLLDSIPARKKLLLLDACHSGEVDKEEMLVMQTAKTKAGNKGLIMNRGSEEETTETKTVGLQNSFELMQSLFVNVGKGTGTTIISAAGGVQFAQERNELRNGVFTYSLLEALSKNKTIRISELKKYVGLRVEQLTDGMQKPTTRNELKDFDWNVW